jgi:hypothetical protein
MSNAELGSIWGGKLPGWILTMLSITIILLKVARLKPSLFWEFVKSSDKKMVEKRLKSIPNQNSLNAIRLKCDRMSSKRL